jgi:hypothetical protein
LKTNHLATLVRGSNRVFIFFVEICHRLQTARPSVIKCLLFYLLPWLYNLELVDPNVSPDCSAEARTDPQQGRGREGWGSSEATEMITNNLFYITVKVRLEFILKK